MFGQPAFHRMTEKEAKCYMKIQIIAWSIAAPVMLSVAVWGFLR